MTKTSVAAFKFKAKLYVCKIPCAEQQFSVHLGPLAKGMLLG